MARLEHRFAAGAARALLALAALFAAACGGGGGGDSGGLPEQPSGQRFPAAASATLREHWRGQLVISQPFRLYAPEDPVFTNGALQGSDAAPFNVHVYASAADAGGYRNISFGFESRFDLNYEDPGDEDRDHVYTFWLIGDVRGNRVRTTINITVQDVLESIPAAVQVVVGETPEEVFGASVEIVPDLTGDGQPEYAVGSLSATPTPKGYLITSDFIANASDGVISVTRMGVDGTRFVDNGSPPLDFENTMLTARASPSGGVDLALSDLRSGRLHLFGRLTEASYASLRGTVSLSAATGLVTYDLPTDWKHEGRLIGDLDGDGLNDLLVRKLGGERRDVWFGIMFGGAQAGAAAFDIALVDATDYGTNERCRSGDPPVPRCVSMFESLMIADLDGDQGRELALLAPDRSAAWVIYGKSIAAPASAPIDIGALAASAGFAHRDSHDGYSSLAEMDDYDGDGSISYALAFDGPEDTILIDAHDFMSAPLAGDLPGVIIGESSDNMEGAYLQNLGDLDGDGRADLLVNYDNGFGGWVLRGSDLALMARGQPPAQPPVRINFPAELHYPDVVSGRPAFAPGAARIAFPVIRRSLSPGAPLDTSGRIVFLDLASITEALVRDAHAIEVSVRQP